MNTKQLADQAAEQLINSQKDSLQSCCCKTTGANKIQGFSLGDSGYRVYCQSCCAVADGTTMEAAIANFRSGAFKHGPQS